ncbi:HNH endonuclease signature motif containing protein [Caenibius sp. WL]|uniref:HNH endonuclease n=1 Tax=Caenibius sp. WL TaxID=2872646 RepID=UPI001C9A19F9|nr:HNH endonuclease signature motif containing protein [Caenibius sp. WL]QZP08199.1 HNH endonuclease [Caenibius sp. WL]
MAWSRTSRHKRGYDHRWGKLRKNILTRDKHLCQECRRKGRVKTGNHVDHIKPKAKGGTDDPGNLQVICAEHHAEKTQREAAEAQGRTYRPRKQFDVTGWPIEG